MTTADFPLRTAVRIPEGFSPSLSWGQLRRGPRDPTTRIEGSDLWKAMRTPDGPATLHVTARSPTAEAEAWGPGAEWALGRAGALCGVEDDRSGWEPKRHPLVAELDRRLPGLRFVASGLVMDLLVPVVLEQKVTSHEAHRSWASVARAWGERAPGPCPLWVPPAPERLAREPYWSWHRFGVERRRADVIRRLASRAARVEEAAALGRDGGRARLEAFHGIGVWTSAEVAAVAWADSDAVSVGDYHIPGIVVYAFTGRRDGDDDAMLELLEPFAGHRARVSRLIELGSVRPDRRAPRARLRDFSEI